MNGYDIYLVGVGGQGVLTIGEIITETAFRAGLPVNFYPTKGMAQRGGFVKAQLRIGRATPGPAIPEKRRGPGDRDRGIRGAESRPIRQAGRRLRALRIRLGADRRHARQGAPTRRSSRCVEQVRAAGARPVVIDPERLPLFEGQPVPDNVYTLGVAATQTSLGDSSRPARWPK